MKRDDRTYYRSDLHYLSKLEYWEVVKGVLLTGISSLAVYTHHPAAAFFIAIWALISFACGARNARLITNILMRFTRRAFY